MKLSFSSLPFMLFHLTTASAGVICEQFEAREDRYREFVYHHTQELKLQYEFHSRFVDNLREKANRTQSMTDAEEQELKRLSQILRLKNLELTEVFAKDIDRKTVETFFASLQTALIEEIELTQSLDESSKNRMKEKIQKTTLLFAGDETPDLKPANQFEINNQIQETCGLIGHELPMNSFNSTMEGKGLVVICPGHLKWAQLSSEGLNSFITILSHEISHSLNMDWANFEFIRQPLPTVANEHAALLACWKREYLSFLDEPRTLQMQMEQRARGAGKEYGRLIDEIKTQTYGIPDAIDLHASEMVADFWAARTLGHFLKNLPNEATRFRVFAENTNDFCAGTAAQKESDDGFHLPRSIRRKWIWSNETLFPYSRMKNHPMVWCEL